MVPAPDPDYEMPLSDRIIFRIVNPILEVLVFGLNLPFRIKEYFNGSEEPRGA